MVDCIHCMYTLCHQFPISLETSDTYKTPIRKNLIWSHLNINNACSPIHMAMHDMSYIELHVINTDSEIYLKLAALQWYC